MSNLVFRVCLLAALCWQNGIAERSANGYFYDKPEGTLFEEGPATSLASSIFPPQQVPQTLELLPPSVPQVPQALDSGLEIVPAQLVFEDTQTVSQGGDFGFQQQENQAQQAYSAGGYQPVAFNLQDGTQAYNSIQQPCGPEPIVAQFNPAFVDLSSGGPLTRQITTCGPNNDCRTITVQADKNRHLGVLQAQGKSNYYSDYQPEPRIPNVAGVYADALVRPPNRRLIEYSEIAEDVPYN